MLVYKLGTLLLALTVGTIAIQQPAVSTFSVRQLYSRQRARLQQQAGGFFMHVCVPVVVCVWHVQFRIVAFYQYYTMECVYIQCDNLCREYLF